MQGPRDLIGAVGTLLRRAWPQSLFGRLVAATVIAVLVAQGVALILIAHERERFVLQERVREWSRRIAEITLMLQPLDAQARVEATNQLIEQYLRFGGRDPRHPRRSRTFRELSEFGFAPLPGRDALRPGSATGTGTRGLVGGGPGGPRGLGKPGGLGGPGGPGEDRDHGAGRARPRVAFLPIPLSGDFEHPLQQALQGLLGADYRVSIAAAAGGAARAIPVSPLQPSEPGSLPERLYDVSVQFPDGGSALFRLARPVERAPIPRNLVGNLALLVVILAVALYITARTITLPLSKLARAADRVGRDVRQPKLQEKGSREIRDAARAFNTMQDRLQRYLDSRTRVLAAMSHDLKTPLTRLRLQVETLEDPAAQTSIGRQLDEMESMVRGALALFKGLDDDEAHAPVDVNGLLTTLEMEFAQLGGQVSIEGAAQKAYTGKPQALKRCLRNLLENAIKFGGRAMVSIRDGAALIIAVRDDGPGIAEAELERVFEPFYRIESSRNRDTGGTGLGLSIARDVAQSHGGTLSLRNLPGGGLEATLTLPRGR